MRILIAHNYYQQPGGEDRIFTTEADLLESRGHQVVRYEVHNDAIRSMGRVALARATVRNDAVFRDLVDVFRRARPDVAHFHNTFPLISPAAYYAARSAGVPVVQSLHNFRLLCASATLYRNGRTCEDCLGRFAPWPGIVHACYRESRVASSVVAAMLAFHRARGTWRELVDIYIVAIGGEARARFARGGLPAERLVVKHNVVYPDPGSGRGLGAYALYVGRLVAEKGLTTLLAAWQRLRDPPPLKVVGDGPMAGAVREATARCGAIELLGMQSRQRVLELMKDARVLVVPSVWHEGSPRVIIEAFAVGLPVIASDLGAMSSLVDAGRTGLRFRPGDAEDLARKVSWAFAHPSEVTAMRDAARAEFVSHYAPERNYRVLIDVYRRAIARSRARQPPADAARAAT